MPESVVKRIKQCINKFRFVVAVRAPWIKKHLKLKYGLRTVRVWRKGRVTQMNNSVHTVKQKAQRRYEPNRVCRTLYHRDFHLLKL